jgi:hypothetical protein
MLSIRSASVHGDQVLGDVALLSCEITYRLSAASKLTYFLHQTTIMMPRSKNEKKMAREAQRTKPKRPISAYNLFFRDERARLLAEAAAKEGVPDAKDKDKKQEAKKKSGGAGPKQKIRAGTAKVQGLISFEQLGKKIGQEWRNIVPERKQYYVEIAKKDTERYKREMADYHAMEDSILQQFVVPATLPEETKSAAQHQPTIVLHVHPPPPTAAAGAFASTATNTTNVNVYPEPLRQLAAFLAGNRDQAGNARMMQTIADQPRETRVQDRNTRPVLALPNAVSASSWLLDSHYSSAPPQQHPAPPGYPFWQQQRGQNQQPLSGPYYAPGTSASESARQSMIQQALSSVMRTEQGSPAFHRQGGMQSASGPFSYTPDTAASDESAAQSMLNQALSSGMRTERGSPASHQQGVQNVSPQMRSFSGHPHEPRQATGNIDLQRLLAEQFAASYRSAVPPASGYAAALQQQDMLRSFERTIAVAQQRQSEASALTRRQVFDSPATSMLDPSYSRGAPQGVSPPPPAVRSTSELPSVAILHQQHAPLQGENRNREKRMASSQENTSSQGRQQHQIARGTRSRESQDSLH